MKVVPGLTFETCVDLQFRNFSDSSPTAASTTDDIEPEGYHGRQGWR